MTYDARFSAPVAALRAHAAVRPLEGILAEARQLLPRVEETGGSGPNEIANDSAESANFGRSAFLSIAVIGRCRGCRQILSSGRNNPPRRGRCNI